MSRAWWSASIAAAGVLLAALLPLAGALDARDVVEARILAAALTVIGCAAAAALATPRRTTAAIAAIAGAAGIALLLTSADANARCLASFDGHSVVIGREHTAAAAEYLENHPGLSASDLLLDAGGAADRIWTAASIARCRFWLNWAGLLTVPLFAACLASLAASRTGRLVLPGAPARAPAGADIQPAYDAFVSYRHGDPDRTYAADLVDALESRGLRVAIDARDFRGNEHIVSEMERCIRQSRLVLCVITARYVDSGYCSEEAIISKTLDLTERRRRLVPLFYERVPLPAWLDGLVGVDCTASASVDPIESLVGLLKT
jgi:TIR domain-containing protein